MRIAMRAFSAVVAVTVCSPSVVMSFGGFQSATMMRSSSVERLSLLAMSGGEFEFDVGIVGCGVGGHGAALHSVAQGFSTVVFAGGDVGGTCVNRGCVPSKALLAASGRVRDMRNRQHLSHLGIRVDGTVHFSREGIAQHAQQLADKVKHNLQSSLSSIGVHVVQGHATLTANPHQLQDSATGQIYTVKDIVLAPGSVPFVPPGITVDGATVYTSDGALLLKTIPEWIAIIGSGYIGLEFSDVYTALGSEVTFIEAMDTIMPTFDREIAKIAERLLIRDRPIDTRTGVFASRVTPGIPGQRPVTIEMIDAKTKKYVETLEVDAVMVAAGRVPNTMDLGLEQRGIETNRGFVPVNEKMQVLMNGKEVVPNVWCIGDANGIMMLAHAASAQGISAIENIAGRTHVVNHLAVPAACFTHPEIAMVGPTEEQCVVLAEKEGWTLGISRGNFRANSKALAEHEGNGIAKVLFRRETGTVVAVHIIGVHAADLIQECANAISSGTTVRELSMMVHTHPTLCEVLDEAFKGAVGMSSH